MRAWLRLRLLQVEHQKDVELDQMLHQFHQPIMPPRIQLLTGAFSATSTVSTSISTFLLPFLHARPQTRSASILASLSDTPGAYNRKIRRGRGPSSGKGKTSGRGHKGQKQKSSIPVGFEGGQTSVDVAHGKAGFKNMYEIREHPRRHQN